MAFLRLLESGRPGDALKEWRGKLPVFFDLARQITAGPAPWHSGSIADHAGRCMNEVAGDPLAVWLAFVHDCGKLTTPQILIPHHYGHELRGEILAPIWARQLEVGDDYGKAGALAARWHMRAGRYPILRKGKKKWLLENFPPLGAGRAFWKVIDADTRSSISEMAIADWLKLQERGDI